MADEQQTTKPTQGRVKFNCPNCGGNVLFTPKAARYLIAAHCKPCGVPMICTDVAELGDLFLDETERETPTESELKAIHDRITAGLAETNNA